MRRHRPHQEPLHSRGPCLCTRSSIQDIPWATRKTRGQVARPSHNAAAHFTSCPHSTLRLTTSVSTTEILAQLRGRRAKRRKVIVRVAVAAA